MEWKFSNNLILYRMIFQLSWQIPYEIDTEERNDDDGENVHMCP